MGLVIFYLSAGFFAVFFTSSFMEIARYTDTPELWSGFGRSVNNLVAAANITKSILSSCRCGRIFFCGFFKGNRYFCLDFKNGGVPPPHFRQIGGLPLYQNRHSVSIIICKDGREGYELQHKLLYLIERYNTKYLPKILTVLLLASLALSACGKKPSETYSSTSIPEPSQNTSTQAEPVTLEQALLKERSLLFSGKYLDKGTTGWNWYRDMDRREYIAFDLDLSELAGEAPIRLFNRNILMTNCAFYEIVYASEPLDGSDTKAQLAPDGSMSPYYPAAQHLNCDLKLRKIGLLTAFYGDVRNISTSHVITVDYTMLPIAEVLTDGYGAYQKYDPCRFYWDYDQK